MRTKKKKNYRIWIFAYILLVVIIYLLIYIGPKVSNIFIKTYTAEYGTLEKAVKCPYLIVRNEKVYTADNGGTVKRVAKTESLLRSYSRIVEVGGTVYHSKDRGVVSYYYDGLEDKFTPENMEDIKSSVLKPKDKEEENLGTLKKCSSKSAEEGAPIFKIVDNKEWYLICWLPLAGIEGISTDKNVEVKLKDGTILKMKVKGINDQGMEKQVILACDRYYRNFDKIRNGECKLIKASREGIVIENSSITEEDGEKGVYIVDKVGNHKFMPIHILLTTEKQSVVASSTFINEEGKMVNTITNYSTVLKIDEEGSKKDAN